MGSHEQRWEYRYAELEMLDSVAPMQELLDVFGDEGWEAVGIAADPNFHLHVLFKRPKVEPVQAATQTRYRDARLTSGRRAR